MADKDIKEEAARAWKILDTHVLTCPDECNYGKGYDRCEKAIALSATWHFWNHQLNN